MTPDELGRPIIELTQQMGELARLADWEALHQLADQRQRLLEAFFDSGFDLEQTVGLIDTVMKADKRLAHAADAARQETAAALQGYRRQQRAAQAYAYQADGGQFRSN